MNWYKLASIYDYAWIDPNGDIFDCGYLSHTEWIGANTDLLIHNYGYDVLENYFDNREELKDYDVVLIDFLLRKDWIRFTWEDVTFIFQVENIKNKILSNIEKVVFDEIQPKNENKIWISVFSGKEVVFSWGDFIGKGENFADYVRSQIR